MQSIEDKAFARIYCDKRVWVFSKIDFFWIWVVMPTYERLSAANRTDFFSDYRVFSRRLGDSRKLLAFSGDSEQFSLTFGLPYGIIKG